jgi:RNA polymerase primary sigma factor
MGAVHDKNKLQLKTARKRRVGRDSESGDSILNWYLNEIHKVPMMDRETEASVAALAQAGDKAARDRLVQANLRFVVTVARKYQSYGLSLMDLINEGNMGLIRAAERFNPDRGYHFISYAVWWIKQAILFAIQQKSALIRLPLNRTADLRRIDEAEKWIENHEEVDNNMTTLSSMLNMESKEIQHLMNMSRDYLSLDAPIGDGEDFSLGDNIMDENEDAPETRTETADLKREIDESLGTLTRREQNVLKLRFGLQGSPVLSLQKIGKKVGLSKERIRQIEKKAIRKIRTGQTGQKLLAYMN